MAQVSYHSAGTKAKEGQDQLPLPLGIPWIANGIYPGWQTGDQFSLNDPRTPAPDPKEVGRGALPPNLGRFKAIRLIGSGGQLEYEVAGVPIVERIEAREQAGNVVVQRHFKLGRVSKSMWLLLGQAATNVTFSVNGTGAILIERPNGLRAVRVSPSEKVVEFNVVMGTKTGLKTWPVVEDNQIPITRWREPVITHGALSKSTEAFVVDNIAIPVTNPWHRNVRLVDVAFFADGRAAAVTFDGDVWIISGLAGGLRDIKWRRFTAGFHEPMSLCIRGDEIFVFDRNGIWRVRDTQGLGEADVHELFSNAFAQTAETREYADGMKLAPDGSFIIAKGGIQMATIGKDNGTVMRVSPDGTTATMLAYGLRSPFVGVHPKTGLITASDQQGNYVPTTPLHIIRDQQFYGFLSSQLPKEKYPAPIADPLTWIPYPVNASGASQTWLVDAKMGPLNDALIHFGYYRPEIFCVRMNNRTARPQAAVFSVARDLEFSPLNGAVNPKDGMLYMTGFQIFGTTAKQLSGLARLRYTGAASTLPREITPMDKGILLRFDVALDAAQATNAANFSVERWNYRRTYNYGSPHFKLDGTKGQETMRPGGVYLSRDGKGLFVGIADMKPVMQMRVGWTLRMKNGKEFTQSGFFTPYELPVFNPSAEGFDPVEVNVTPSASVAGTQTPQTPEEGKRLAELMGCVACHSSDGSMLGKVGPSWKGLFGSEVLLADGRKVSADEAYIRESIKEPAAKVVRGFDKSDTAMPSYEGIVSDAQIEALILYLKQLR